MNDGPHHYERPTMDYASLSKYYWPEIALIIMLLAAFILYYLVKRLRAADRKNIQSMQNKKLGDETAKGPMYGPPSHVILV